MTSIMAAFDILNPSKLPKLPLLTFFLQYGNTEIESLARQFDVAINDAQDSCVEEWASFGL